jgi:hypothetical protein
MPSPRSPARRAARVVLAVGSDEGVRVWVNGALVLSRDGLRSLTLDEDQVEIDLKAGEKHGPRQGSPDLWSVAVQRARSGARHPPLAPRGDQPLDHEARADGFTLKTDSGPERTDAPAVQIEVVGPGARRSSRRPHPEAPSSPSAPRTGRTDPGRFGCTTHSFDGRLHSTHLPWYKGDALVKARELAAAARAADAKEPEGFTLKMLAEMVDDRLGEKVALAQGNPWWRIHSPLMEFRRAPARTQGKDRAHSPSRLRTPGLSGRGGRIAAVLPRLPARGLRRLEEMADGAPDPRLQPREHPSTGAGGPRTAGTRHRHRVLRARRASSTWSPTAAEHPVPRHGRHRQSCASSPKPSGSSASTTTGCT